LFLHTEKNILIETNRYGVSKLLEVFFVREIASRITASSKPKIIVNCMTPGACRSEFDRESTGFAKLFGLLLQLLVARTTEAGSRTLVAGIAAGQESHGEYMADCIVAR
jgi:retinol dehydrogenase-12